MSNIPYDLRLNEATLVDKANVLIKKLMTKIEKNKKYSSPARPALFGQAGWAEEPHIAKFWLLLANLLPNQHLLY